jgi:hypothetical protein
MYGNYIATLSRVSLIEENLILTWYQASLLSLPPPPSRQALLAPPLASEPPWAAAAGAMAGQPPPLHLPQLTSVTSLLSNRRGRSWRPPLHWPCPAPPTAILGRAQAAKLRVAPGPLLPARLRAHPARRHLARRPSSWLQLRGTAAGTQPPSTGGLPLQPAVGDPPLQPSAGAVGQPSAGTGGSEDAAVDAATTDTVVDPTSNATGGLVMGAMAHPFPFGMPPWTPTPSNMVGTGASTNPFPAPPPPPPEQVIFGAAMLRFDNQSHGMG